MVQKTTYVDDDDKNDVNYGTMKRITFNDTYGGMIGGTLLYRLDPTKLIEVHKTYGNQDNLVENGLKPISKQLLAYTANQFSGENMKKVTTHRLEKLESVARICDEKFTAIISFVERDAAGKMVEKSGLRLTEGKEMEELPASYFDNEDLQDEFSG